MTKVDRVAVVLFLAGTALFATGQLLLPFAMSNLRGSEDVGFWDETLRAGAPSDFHRTTLQLADLWNVPGALIASVSVAVLVGLVLWGHARRWLPAIVAAVATLWQLGTYETLIHQLDFVPTPKPGSGILASALGSLLLAAAAIRLARTPHPQHIPSRPAG